MLNNGFSKVVPFMRQYKKKVVERGRPQATIWLMRSSCWIPKATNTHTGCVIFIAFPLQHWLHQRFEIIK